MKRKRTAKERREMIVKGTRHLVAVGGMSNFSFPKLMAETGINAPAVYELYKNKTDLLESCYLEIDREIAQLVERNLKHAARQRRRVRTVDEHCWALWFACWNYLVQDAERTLFYWEFYHSRYYTKEVNEKRKLHVKSFLQFVEEIAQRYHISERSNRRVLLGNLIRGTITGAMKVLQGRYPNDNITITTIYRTVLQPIFMTMGLYTGDSDERSFGG